MSEPPTPPTKNADAPRTPPGAHDGRPSPPVGSRALRMGYLAAATVIVLGTVASLVAARQVRRSGTDGQAAGFAAEVGTVSDRVDVSLASVETLMSAQQTFTAGRASASIEDFATWYDETTAGAKSPNIDAVGYVDRVGAADLPGYLGRYAPSTALDASSVFPPGPRDEYCLVRPGAWTAATFLTADFSGVADVCALGFTSLVQPATDQASVAVAQAPAGLPKPEMVWFVPVYDQGVIPPSEEDRRAAVVGWASGLFDIDNAIAGALSGHEDLGAQLVWTDTTGRTQTIGEAGAAGGDPRFSRTVPLHSGTAWSLTVSGDISAGGVSPSALGYGVLAGGMLLSVVFAVFIVLLSRSRQKAMQLVDRKTGQLRYQALHDSLTGLPNRDLVLEQAEQLVRRCGCSQGACAALFVDLDGFKEINDTLGHSAGDELLKAVANRLRAIMRSGDTVGRLGGDEFVVLVAELDDGFTPENVADRVLEAMRSPFQLPAVDAEALHITASIGIAGAAHAGAVDLLRDADVALYRAKADGRDRWVRFAPEMQAELSERVALGMDLRASIDGGQLFLTYQPTIDLARMQLVGMEALVRWRHPTRGLIMPDQFIPLAEDTGYIVDIGRWVIHEACREAAGWAARGVPLKVGVNVSARQLDDARLVNDVERALADSGLDARLLVLEITETAVMADTEATIVRLAELKRLGLELAIDDFGTGYSSLAYLSRFPIDTLKIDRSFVADVTSSPESGAMIHTLVQLGKSLGLQTIAEGVEHLEQMQFLRDEHCDLGQGYLFAKPLRTDQLPEFLARWADAGDRALPHS